MPENIKDNLPTLPQPASTSVSDARILADFVCRMCGVRAPVCGFYRNAKLKRGHLSVCASCHTARTVRQRRQKKLNDPNYVDGRKTRPRMTEEERVQSNRERSRRHYYKNLDRSREKNREHARLRHLLNPQPKREAMLKAKYGLTLEAWQALFEMQGRRCAICLSSEPNAKKGWSTDHCHKTGAVRFILCTHCNRGLGAFKDDPGLMRRAADMLEKIAKNPARPVAAIMEKG